MAGARNPATAQTQPEQDEQLQLRKSRRARDGSLVGGQQQIVGPVGGAEFIDGQWRNPGGEEEESEDWDKESEPDKDENDDLEGAFEGFDDNALTFPSMKGSHQKQPSLGEFKDEWEDDGDDTYVDEEEEEGLVLAVQGPQASVSPGNASKVSFPLACLRAML